MRRRNTGCADTIVAGATDRIANEAVIHERGKRKTYRVVASITGSRNGNVRCRLPNGDDAIMASFALLWRTFKNSSQMT